MQTKITIIDMLTSSRIKSIGPQTLERQLGCNQHIWKPSLCRVVLDLVFQFRPALENTRREQLEPHYEPQTPESKRRLSRNRKKPPQHQTDKSYEKEKERIML